MLYSVVFEHKIGYTQFIKVGFRSQCANMYPESSARVVVSNALMVENDKLKKGESRGGAENKEEDVVMDGDKEWDWEQSTTERNVVAYAPRQQASEDPFLKGAKTRFTGRHTRKSCT
ncbi:hypothetical protein R6Q59_017501 [Mikania micrantha]